MNSVTPSRPRDILLKIQSRARKFTGTLKGYRQRIGVFLLLTAVSMMIVLAAELLRSSQPQAWDYEVAELKKAKSFGPVQVPNGWLSVNEAGTDELVELKGIGETLASFIIEERERNGMFYYPEDLLAVKGIGPAKLGQIREELNFSFPVKEENGE